MTQEWSEVSKVDYVYPGLLVWSLGLAAERSEAAGAGPKALYFEPHWSLWYCFDSVLESSFLHDWFQEFFEHRVHTYHNVIV